jgi:hypothetical protein
LSLILLAPPWKSRARNVAQIIAIVKPDASADADADRPSPRAIVARVQARPRPFAIVTGLLGVTLLAISVYLAFVTPRPSEAPEREPGGESFRIDCADLPGWIERTASQGYTSVLRVRGRLVMRREDNAKFLECDHRRWQLEGGVPNNADGILVRITTDGRLVTSAGGPLAFPRESLRADHRVAMGLGALGALLMLWVWIVRPFDPLRDLVGARAPLGMVALREPANDRCRLHGAHGVLEVRHRFASCEEGTWRSGGSLDAPHIGLPGAEEGYRDAAGGRAYVQGPARVNGLTVRAGERAPLADGDLVSLGRAREAVRVELPEPGRVLRYLVDVRSLDDAEVRLVHRLVSTRPWGLLVASHVLGAGAAVALHADVGWWWAPSLLLGLTFWVVARRIPAQLAQPVEERVPLKSLLDGAIELTTRDEGALGRSLLADGRPVGRLVSLDELARVPPERRACIEQVERELVLLGVLVETQVRE